MLYGHANVQANISKHVYRRHKESVQRMGIIIIQMGPWV